MSKIDLVNELHRAARKNFIRRKTEMRGICDTLQADLVEMIPYAQQNRGMKYILVVINIFSKMAYACPLKNKTGCEVTRAMKSILQSIKHPIKNIHVDMGNEFYNSSMRKLLQRYNINIYSTFTTMKAAIVERLNRTLKNRLWKEFSYRGSYKWIDILKKIIDNYNHTKHRTIRMKPIDVNSKNEEYLMKTVYNYKRIITEKSKPKFKIGDQVRLSKYKHIFEKGYTPNWTTEIFKIAKIQSTNPITYVLSDNDDREIKGSVYEHELQLAMNPSIYLVERIIRKRGNMIFVKWLGFNDNHNSWIHENDVI